MVHKICGHLPQKGEGPSRCGKYRSIALTSTIRKVLERLIAHRLSWWLEEHSALSFWQVGFHKGCSTTDKCLSLSQFIFDGFQSTQRKRTVATFIDTTRAYNRVWRTDALLTKMSKMGVPCRFTEWLSSWFINRTAIVQVNGSIKPSRTLQEGQPLGLHSIHNLHKMVEFEDDTLECLR